MTEHVSGWKEDARRRKWDPNPVADLRRKPSLAVTMYYPQNVLIRAIFILQHKKGQCYRVEKSIKNNTNRK